MFVLTQPLLAQLVPRRQNKSYKGTYGHVLCIGGNLNYGGAIIISAQAAVQIGAGLVSVACDPTHHNAINSRCPEIICYDWTHTEQLELALAQADVIVIGCGLGRDEFAYKIMQRICELQTPTVFDADSLYWLATTGLEPRMPRIYTPHLGEWQRFTHDVQMNVVEQAQKLAPVVVLKSEMTHIYTEHQTYLIANGTPAMASGGMGDCLAGSIAGWLAQSRNLEHAACVGTWLHSESASRLACTQYTLTASKVNAQFPELLKELETY